MEQPVRAFDHQYLETADLLVLRAEIQKLRDSIRAAEASKRRAMLGHGKPAKKIARNRDSNIAEVSVLCTRISGDWNLSRLKESRYGLPVFSPQGPQPEEGGPSFLSSSWGRFWNERGRQLSRPYFSGGLM